MAQIYNPGPSFGGNLGAAFGGGIGQSLQRLADAKMQQMERSQISKAFQASGMPAATADALSWMDPQSRQTVLKQIMEAPYQQALSQAMSEVSGHPYQQQTNLSQILAGSTQPASTLLGQTFQQPAVTVPQTGIKALQEGMTIPEMVGELSKQISALEAIQQAPTVAQGKRQSVNTSMFKPQDQFKILQLQQAQESRAQQQQMAEKKLEQQERFHKEKLSAKEQEISDKETLPYYRDVLKNAKSVKDSDMRLDRIEEITKKDMAKGTLTDRFSILMNEFLREKHKILGTDFGGIDFSSLMTGDTQELQKLSADFARGAASALRTNRLTNAELKLFMNSVPTLLQSNEGRIRVIANMRIMNDMTKLEKDTMDKIIKENGGKRPRDLENQVDERMDPKLDELSKKFTTAADDAVANAQQWVSSIREKEKKKPILPKVAKNIEALSQHNSLLGKALSGIMG